MIFIRTANNYDTNAASDESGLKCEDLSKTQQHQKEEADINTIVKRFGLTGQLPSNVRVPTYGDFTGVSDYQSALNAVMAAEASFMAMPVDIRARFNHDPEQFVEFCSNPDNTDEMIKLGLAVKTQTTEATPPAPPSVSAPTA